MDLSSKTAYVYMQMTINDIVNLLLEKDKLIEDQKKQINLHQNTILDKIDILDNQQDLILKQHDTIEKYHQIIEQQKKEIEEQQTILDLKEKQILFIKNMIKTVSNVFVKKEKDHIPEIEPKVELETKIEIETEQIPKRKSNKTQYKLPSDIVSCEICNSKMRRDCFKRHLKTKQHLKNII